MKLVDRTAQHTSGLWAALLALLVLVPAGAWGVSKEAAGKALYLKYCSACHGPGAKGDGVASGFLQPPPPDLTQIAKRSGGQFPFIKVAQAIDGTRTIPVHGEREMPVWGEIFRQDGPAGPIAEHAAERSTVTLITEYVGSLQQK